MAAKAVLWQLAVLAGARSFDASSTRHPPSAVAFVQALRNGDADPVKAAWANVSMRGTKPGAYVHWDVPGGLAKQIEIEHTWHSLPGGTWDGNAVFMSMMIPMQDNEGGYMGTQMHGGIAHIQEQSLSIFSLWDCRSSKAQTVPYGSNCQHECTGEGCFTQCRTTAPIQQNVRYLQQVKYHHYDGQHVWWEWSINGNPLGQIGAPNCNGRQGFGDMVVGPSSGGFMEYPSDTPYGDCNAAYCNVGWRGPYFNNRALRPTQAHPEYNTACGTSSVLGYDNVDGWGSSSNPVISMQGGKGTQRSTTTGQNLWSQETKEKNSTLII
eukprot:TRINITY_DN49718_c0_g1_i1.p1 TRINITY_DN49718_c0_g1~~TRINITY_DN49718_c0_g1_i1.p1  ORF type:complete len:350 (+),score=25.55 TRINITY_DN49718_c0_g1_i1:82-1050(+)